MLSGLGLKQVLPVRQTPKLIFFILGNSTEKKRKAAEEGSDASEPVVSLSEKKKEGGPKDAASVTKAPVHRQMSEKSTTGEEFNWKDCVRAQFASALKAGTLKHFTQDYSEVPPNEFAIELSADLVDLC